MEQVQYNRVEAKCELCGDSKSIVEAFCRQCDMYICKGCIGQHKRLKTFTDHMTVPLTSLKTEQASNSNDMSKPPATDLCNDHEELLVIYCFDCNKLICRDCTVKDHRDHNFEFIKKAAKEARSNLLEKMAPLRKLVATLSDTLTSISKTKQELSIQREAAAFIIRASFKELREILDTREEELLGETTTIVQEKMSKLSSQENSLCIVSTKIEDILDYTELCASHGTDDEVMNMHEKLTRKIDQEMEEHGNSESSLMPVESAAIKVQVNCYEALQQLCLTKANVVESFMNLLNESIAESICNESNTSTMVMVKKDDHALPEEFSPVKIETTDSDPENSLQYVTAKMKIEVEADDKDCIDSVNANGDCSPVESTPQAEDSYYSFIEERNSESCHIALPSVSAEANFDDTTCSMNAKLSPIVVPILPATETAEASHGTATEKMDSNYCPKDSTLPTLNNFEDEFSNNCAFYLNSETNPKESEGNLSTMKELEVNSEDCTATEIVSNSSPAEFEPVVTTAEKNIDDCIAALNPDANSSLKECMPAVTTVTGFENLNSEVGEVSKVILIIGEDINSNPETNDVSTTSTVFYSKHRITSSLKSLHSGNISECAVDKIVEGKYFICLKPTVRGRHKLVVSVNGQQISGSPFQFFVSISPTQLCHPVKLWKDIPKPMGVTVNSEGKVLVATSNGNIIKLKKSGKYETLLEQHTLTGLHKIETDDENNIFCGSEINNVILQCDQNGENVRLQEIKHKNWLRGMAIFGKEVMVTQGGNRGTIHVYNRRLKYIRSIQHHGDKGCFWAISTDSKGNIYCADRNNSCIHVFEKNGTFIRSIGLDDAAVIDTPQGICVSGPYVFVCDQYSCSVLAFTTEGKYVSSFGQWGYSKGHFNKPTSICANRNGFLYVTDSANDRVQCF